MIRLKSSQKLAGYIVLLMIIWPAVLYSQKYSLKIYTTADGLPPFAAERIIQDRLGNLWITTGGGVVMYNGKVFRVFTTDEGIPNNATRAICEDRYGHIWVGTLGGGAVKFMRNGFGNYDLRAFTTANGLTHNAVLSLQADTSGNVWLGTKNGVTVIQTDSLSQNIHIKKLLEGRSIDQICIASDGTAWFGEFTGKISWLSDGKIQTISPFQVTSGISGIEEDKNRVIWVTSFDHGVKQIKVTEKKAEILTGQLPELFNTKIYGTIKTQNKSFLFSTFGAGLIIKDDGAVNFLTAANGLPEDNITAAFEDREGTLWIGTANSGLVKLVSYPFVNYDKESGLAGNYVLDVIQDSRGAYWFTSYESGLTRYDGKSYTVFTAKDGLQSKSVYALMEDSQGRIWVTTTGQGVFVYDGKKFTPFNKKNIYLTDVLCLLEDKEKNIWFGTDAYGAIRYSPDKQFVQFGTNQGLAGLRVFSMIQDRKGRILFGCGQPSRFKEAGGLSVWDPERFYKNLNPFTTFSKNNGFPANQVTVVYEDKQNNLWLGTRQAGLILFSDGIIQTFTKRDGLTSNDVVALQEDKKGRLWIGTVQGLNIWDGKNMESYTVKKGLLSDEVYENAMISDRQGNIWFGTPRGACRFKLSEKPMPVVPPLVYIDKIRSFGKEITTEVLNQLSFRQNSLDFQVVGIELRSEKDMIYQFMLEGYDHDWEDPTVRDFISYTNLDPGKYVFRARARGVSGAWSEPSAVAFEIIPAFWQTIWFRIGCVVFVVVMIPVAYKYSIRSWKRFRKWRSLRIIAQYKIKNVIGEGAMGVVYLAFDKSSRIHVALKVINEKLMSDPDNRSRFVREGRILSKLRHPFVVKVYATGESMGRGYIAMEILKKGDLKSYLKTNFPLKHNELERLLICIAEGLSYIHQQAIVHRDFKCENIMLDEHFNPKIMDFGLSKSVLVTAMTQVGTIMGTLGYVAPEQITGGKTDHRSDIFSFGVVMYEMMTNRLPFRGENEIAMIHSIFNDQPALPSKINPSVLPLHEKIVMKCLEKDPDNRYQKCEDILNDLRPEEIRIY
ncbi:protein kinase [bacterium]|nr:protein kinase [bacterium]